MSRVKLHYIVSFSSEDPENPASNLLYSEISKKKWLCKKGESSCSVVIQLTKAVQISAVHIGAYRSALVEVLVGRSEAPDNPFEVLVPSCVFQSPAEARHGGEAAAGRVRSFSGSQLAGGARAQRWDRVRVVCLQPYDRHCKYGLSFVHVYEGEASTPSLPLPPAAPVAPLCTDSDEEFRPGELFASVRALQCSPPATVSESQVLKTSLLAIKRVTDSSAKVVRSPALKELHSRRDGAAAAAGAAGAATNRSRDALLYTDDDCKPHAKIDRIVQTHKLGNSGDKTKHPRDTKTSEVREHDARAGGRTGEGDERPDKGGGNRKRKRRCTNNQNSDKGRGDSEAAPAHTLLAGVVFALSGYENPRRAALRDTALAMGARFEKDVTSRTTHLICAFENTPKLRALRAGGGGAGGDVMAVRGEWVEQCAARRRLLPPLWFATESARRVSPPARDPLTTSGSDDADTDDDIRRVLHDQKRRRIAPAPAPGDADESCQYLTLTTSEAESESSDSEAGRGGAGGALPAPFEGCTFSVDAAATRAGFDAAMLARYVRAYGGHFMQEGDGGTDGDARAQYTLSAASAGGVDGETGGVRVRADWLWRCVRAERLLPPGEDALV